MTQQRRTRIPKIAPKQARSGNIYIRFRLTQGGQQNNYELTLPLKWNNPRDRRKAEMIAERIRDDIASDVCSISEDAFDSTLEKYRGGKRKSQPRKKTEHLLSVWLRFVEFKVKEGKIQETTLRKVYPNTEKVLRRVFRHDPELLKPDKASEILDYLTERYKPSTLELYYKHWSACANWAVKRDIWDKNPYSRGLSEVKSQCKSVKSGKSYSDKESNVILEAFLINRFASPHATVKQSYYYQFLKFLFLTGVRPQLAIALDWEQIIWEDGQPTKIFFDRACTYGILKPSKGDRNGKNTPRVFPVNRELGELIKAIPKRETIHREPTISKHLTQQLKRPYYPELLFPAPRGWYININNFTNRIFKPVVEALVEAGEIKEYLSTYHTRHTVQNRCLESGMSEEDIAALLDTSPEIVRNCYRDDRRYHQSIAERCTMPSLNKEDEAI